MIRASLVLATLAIGSTPAHAKDKPVFVEAEAMKDKPAVALDPAKAYILVRSDAQLPLYLMKVPTAEDSAAYDALRAEAFAEARAKYVKRLAAYERDAKAAAAARQRPPEKPVEPTEATFAITPFNLLAGAPVGPLNRFAKGENGGSTYLHAVTPGTYRIYGLLSMVPNAGMVGSCFCMGSVAFAAPAGVVTDLGTAAIPAGKEAEAARAAGTPAPLLSPSPAGSLDQRLSTATVQPARFVPAGKLPNYFGVTIDRMPAMPGVMRYDRDRIVDLTGEGAAPAGH